MNYVHSTQKTSAARIKDFIDIGFKWSKSKLDLDNLMCKDGENCNVTCL